MGYFLSSIIVVVSAIVILFTRYEADDSAITTEIERMKVMILSIDDSVNTYVESGSSLDSINFEVLANEGMLLTDAPDVTNTGNESTYSFPNNEVVWQLIPNIDDGNSYKLLVDMRANSSLMSKSNFSESFIGREYCEKALFGTFEESSNSYKDADEDFENSGTGSKSDGLFVCIVFK